MTTPAPEEQEQPRPTQAEVIGAFAAAAVLAAAAARPRIFWLAQLDAVLLPLLGFVYAAAFAPTPQVPVPATSVETYLRRVREHLTDIDLEQPRRAAVTEFKAARHAGRMAGKEAKLPPGSTKRWRTQRDARVRDSHRALEGVTIGVGEDFNVGGFDAPVPGWWTLPPGERAACRCRLTYKAAPAMTAADDGGDEPVDTPVAAGLAVVARDTGRVLMLQRHLDDSDDPHAGKWEFPGGTLDDGETPLDAALREFTEETGVPAPGALIDEWVSPNGVYQLFVATVEAESELDLDSPTPDDPDGEVAEALAWWMPQDAAQNPALRAEVMDTPWSLLDCGCDGGASEAAGDLDLAAPVEVVGDDPLEAAILLHRGLMDGSVPMDDQTHLQLMDLLEAAAYGHDLPVDADEELVAAGGADRNRGNAERLRRYWTTGPGGARIGWGSPGDWTRCVSELNEHLGVRAKGYCALRHKEMNGVWPGDRDGKLTAALEDEDMTDPRVLAALTELQENVKALLGPSTAGDLLAAGSPYPGEHVYDAALFADPNLTASTPLTVDGNRVYGHVATWDTCHRSFKKCRTAPRSHTGYAQFHVGEAMTSAGPLAVGSLVLATDHASLTMTANAASQHYADSGSAVAVVRAGEDRHGIWVAGSIIEGTPAPMVAALRRCPLSGDWRAGEMVAALAVNVPGLPIAREHYANGKQLSMVASGPMPEPDRFDTLYEQIRSERLANLYADILAERVLQ